MKRGMMTVLAVAVLVAWAGAAQAAVTYNGNLTSTTQIRTASNNPFFTAASTVQVDVAGVNFYDSWRNSSPSIGPVNGVGFDDINFGRNTTNRIGPFNLAANGAGPVLTIAWGIADFTERFQTGFAPTGPDAAQLTAVAQQIFYMSSGSGESATMTFTGIGLPSDNLYVQIIGGDEGWTGAIAVESNGASVGTWNAADGNVSTASLFAFDTTADLSGNLQVKVTGSSSFTGVSGIIVSREAVIPEPATMSLLGLGGLAALLKRRRA